MADNAPILESDEVARRMLLLAELQAALHGLNVTCHLARYQRLVLLYNQAPQPPSGLTDPILHVYPIFPKGHAYHVTTDGTCYRLGDWGIPAGDPKAAALAICEMQLAPS